MKKPEFKNLIVCSPKTYEKLLNKKYNKKIEPTHWCRDDEWFYFTKGGKMRTVCSDGSIWTSIHTWCELLNMEVPSGYMKRIR